MRKADRRLMPAWFEGDSYPFSTGPVAVENGVYEPVVIRDEIDQYGDYQLVYWERTDRWVDIEQPDHSKLAYRVYKRRA